MKNTIYTTVKQTLIQSAKQLKRQTNDLPMIRQALNDLTDTLVRELNYAVMKDEISEKQANIYTQWLISTCCKLHP